MSNSALVDYIKLSPNHSGRRTQPIDKIAIHHVAGVLSVETIGNIFSGTSREASSNYGIGYDGRVGMYVEEANRSWCTSSNWVDQQAATIETSNSGTGGNWPVSNHVLAKLVDLCVDICKRNGIKQVTYTGDKNGTLVLHCWFAATACPGPFLKTKMKWLEEQINARLGEEQTTVSDETYTVIPGDSLYKIETKKKVPWQTLAKLNGITAPYTILPGQILRLTDTAQTQQPAPVQNRKTHKVKSGETLYGIAKAWTTTWQDIAQLNGLPNASMILPGQVLSMPLSAVEPTSKPTPTPASAPKPAVLKVGDKVRVTFGSKTYTGQSLADFVYRTEYTVMEISGDRVVIGIQGRVTAAMGVESLSKS